MSSTPNLDRLPTFETLAAIVQLVAEGASDHATENEGRCGSTLAQREVCRGRADRSQTLCVEVLSMVLDGGRIDVRLFVLSNTVLEYNLAPSSANAPSRCLARPERPDEDHHPPFGGIRLSQNMETFQLEIHKAKDGTRYLIGYADKLPGKKFTLCTKPYGVYQAVAVPLVRITSFNDRSLTSFKNACLVDLEVDES